MFAKSLYRRASAVHTHEDIGQTTLSRQTNVGSGLTTQSRLTAKCNYAQPTLGGKGISKRANQSQIFKEPCHKHI